MIRLPSLLLIASIFSGPVTTAADKNEKAGVNTAPQLISTTGGGGAPPWHDTKELTAFAAQGDPQACLQLGLRLLEGDAEVRRDPVRARVLLEQAAKSALPDALFRLGKMHHDGLGGPRDYGKAIENYTAAARRGVPEAQHNLGAMLVSGRGVKRNYVEGLAWLILAGRSGAVADSEARVRERLAKRPADIQAAEARAAELASVLAHAVVHTGVVAAPVDNTPRELKPPTIAPAPLVAPTIAAPKFAPVTPPKLTVPLTPPLPDPR